ncbi:MAG: DUF998 domain-containing protein, partial [Deltaproteobacteria bacterium]|nr:DUF998 domain-containing protein [Deltaproteobacteria bacterium]
MIRDCAMLGLLGALVFACLWTTAVSFDGNWILGEDTLSELGGNGGGRFFFNVGVLIMGIAGLAFSTGLYMVLGSPLRGSGAIILFVGAMALIGVGVFPINTGEPHTFFSYLFFGLMLFSMAMLSFPVWKSPWIGALGGAITVMSLGISMVFLFICSVPLAEAVAVICLLIWTITVSSLILVRFSHRTG